MWNRSDVANNCSVTDDKEICEDVEQKWEISDESSELCSVYAENKCLHQVRKENDTV